MAGVSGKAPASKLMEEPGPHSSDALGVPADVPVGDAAPVSVGEAVSAAAEVAVVVAGVWPAFGAAHDTTVEIAISKVNAEPRADSLFGWNISTAFHVELIAISNCRRPTSLEAEFRGSTVQKKRGAGSGQKMPPVGAEAGLPGKLTGQSTRRVSSASST